MRYSLAFVAAAVGSASAAYVPAGYGGYNGGYGGEYTSIPIGTGYPVPSSSSEVYAGPSSSPASYPSGDETPSSYPTGTVPSYPHFSPSGYSPHSPYSPSGYPTQSYPTGTGNYPHHPSGTVTYSYPHGTGSYPHPTGTDSYHPYRPHGTGSVPPYGSGSVPPHGTGTHPPYGPITTQSSPITTKTHSTGTGTSTYTLTHTGTITSIKTITDYVPCSSPVGTASGSTYYSTYLTVSYHTSIVTATTTEIEVVCPTGFAHTSPEVQDHHAGYPSQSHAVPTSHASPEYPASTAYGPGSKPTAGVCPPSETTVYSTLVVTVTADANGKPTACAGCSTYHITLPNGHATDVVVPPADNPTHLPGHIETPSAPYPTKGAPHYPIGSGTGSYVHPTGTGTAVVPTGSASYGHVHGYEYRL